MRFLPIPISQRNLPTQVFYEARNRIPGPSFPDQSFPLPPGMDASTCPELTLIGNSPKVHFSGPFFNHSLGAFVQSIIRSIFSYDSGNLRNREISAYREAERFQTSEDDKTSRILDIYVCGSIHAGCIQY